MAGGKEGSTVSLSGNLNSKPVLSKTNQAPRMQRRGVSWRASCVPDAQNGVVFYLKVHG